MTEVLLLSHFTEEETKLKRAKELTAVPVASFDSRLHVWARR